MAATADRLRSRRDRLADLGEAMLAAYGRVCADEGVLFGVASRLAGVVEAARRGDPLDDGHVDQVLADARRLGLLGGPEPDAVPG